LVGVRPDSRIGNEIEPSESSSHKAAAVPPITSPGNAEIAGNGKRQTLIAKRIPVSTKERSHFTSPGDDGVVVTSDPGLWNKPHSIK
jgi:hypothetical protein